MLQISILHSEDSVIIQEVKDLSKLEVLTIFDDKKGYIDLKCLKDYIGQQVIVSHFKKDFSGPQFDYDSIKTITKIDRDENDIWFLQYR